MKVRPPSTDPEWERYYDLRWRVLRGPWDQPRGSERDDRETESTHLAIWDAEGAPLAVGRVHLNSPTQAQVRFMAVEPGSARSGLGGKVLAGLEAKARELGATEMVLDAREGVRAFYERHGYAVTGPAQTMFGTVRHVRMHKLL